MSTLIVASEPNELVAGQRRLIEDVGTKLATAIDEARAAKDTSQKMIAARLDTAKARLLHRRATARVVYLTKMRSALEAGYVMMPDMPGDLVAIRSDRNFPSPAAQIERTSTWRGSPERMIPDETARGLPAGAGRYVSPRQNAVRWTTTQKDKAGKDETVYHARAGSLRDPDGLDRRFIRPQVIDRTTAAMTMGIFDEIACVRPQSTRSRRSRDPIVLGRIVDPDNRAVAVFLIAWFVDSAEL